ncbi:MAG: DUF177 domain-containing protein [Bacillota bacterium]
MFTISVARLKKAPAEQRRYHLEDRIETFVGPDGRPVTAEAPVELDLVVTNAGDFIWATGVVSATVNLICSRCVKEYAERIEGRFEEKYRLHGGVEDYLGKEIPVAADELDFSDQVRESLILSLPMKPLCAVSCPGLCPGCGKDLNNGACDCPGEGGDPRFSVLSKLLMQREKGGGDDGSTEK